MEEEERKEEKGVAGSQKKERRSRRRERRGQGVVVSQIGEERGRAGEGREREMGGG